MNIKKFIDKEYETITLKEVAAAFVDVIAGISVSNAKLLKELCS